MSYTINKTDGTVLTDVVDGTVDQSATDLTLIGKNASSYGEFFNENFVHLLENFANSVEPPNKITGQLWYDTSENRLKVYDGIGFKVSGGTIVADTVPSTIVQGDIWIDSKNQQLYFNDGLGTILAGPIYKSSQGVSGFEVLDVFGTDAVNHTIVALTVSNTIIGIFSKSNFTPASEIPGFAGPIGIGFNAAPLSGISFNVNSTSANYLVAADDTNYRVEDFLTKVGDNTLLPDPTVPDSLGTLSIYSSKPLILGPFGNVELSFTQLNYQLVSNVPNQNFQIKSSTTGGLKTSLFIGAELGRVGIYNDTPEANLHVGTDATNGNVIIEGDLTVKGITTTISTTDLVITDKNIVLAAGNSADDIADGGGITLLGDTDKTLIWVDATDSWTSSEHLNLITNKEYKIAGNSVLSATTLGSGITIAAGLTELQATLEYLNVDKLNINADTITYNGEEPYGDIVLVPKGIGSVNVSSKKIINLANPSGSDNYEAVNVGYLNRTVRSAPLGFVLDVTDLSPAALDQQVGFVVSDIFLPADHELGTNCRVHCYNTALSSRVVKNYIVSGTVDSKVWLKTGADIPSNLT